MTPILCVVIGVFSASTLGAIIIGHKLRGNKLLEKK